MKDQMSRWLAVIVLLLVIMAAIELIGLIEQVAR
jgi:hypothetical protein